jgi:hypothetical protein
MIGVYVHSFSLIGVMHRGHLFYRRRQVLKRPHTSLYTIRLRRSARHLGIVPNADHPDDLALHTIEEPVRVDQHSTEAGPVATQRGAFRRPRELRSAVGAAKRAYSSSGNSFSSASENTGPSTHTYFGPTLQRPQMPMPHFMRFSRVV